MKVWEAQGGFKVIAVGGEAGHEVRGEVPECLLLPTCTCTGYCDTPEQHLLEAHAATILALVRRLQETAGVTIMVETAVEKEKCKAWIVKRVGQVKVTTVEEFRGMEADTLLWIRDSGQLAFLLDACTRVTGMPRQVGAGRPAK